MASGITWVPIQRASRREWPGRPLTNLQRRDVRQRLEDGRLQTRALTHYEDGLASVIEVPLPAAFWKEVTLLFTKSTSDTYRIEMNGVIRECLAKLLGNKGVAFAIEVNEGHLNEMFLDYENEETILLQEKPSEVPTSASAEKRQVASREKTADDRANDRKPAPGSIHLTSVQVRNRYGGIKDMTLYRWLNKREMDFPKPIMINNRRYWTKSSLDEWDAKQQS